MADPSLQQWELNSFRSAHLAQPVGQRSASSISSDSHYLYQSASISSNTRGGDSSIDSSSYPRRRDAAEDAKNRIPPTRDSSPRILSFETRFAGLLRRTAHDRYRQSCGGSSSLLPGERRKPVSRLAKPSSLNHLTTFWPEKAKGEGKPEIHAHSPP
ncbi:hypothetical protein HPP92_024672 [Vanilla planifolia]|uniref:Uncharacterized protein n=1 Tax=Vanilla planifolia TaxID=51239 RepID=A0A835PLU5_VANPL|nr:hypothetical protein HPP92_024966 [Vanilla planifolia]KAG0456884.1 hypothetical protein HPP92_024672 [Vanilla planifolia]